MGYQIAYAPLASDDLEQIVRHVAQDSPRAALILGCRLADQAESLVRQPYRGSMLQKRPGVRKLVCPPYLIVYRLKESLQIIEVLRFWHGARDLRQMELT